MQAADYKKYGSLLTNLATQHSSGNNQYPKTFDASLDVLSNYTLDPKYYEQRKQDKDKLKNNAKQEDANPHWMPPAMLRRARNTDVIAVVPAITISKSAPT